MKKLKVKNKIGLFVTYFVFCSSEKLLHPVRSHVRLLAQPKKKKTRKEIIYFIESKNAKDLKINSVITHQLLYIYYLINSRQSFAS